MNSSRVTRRGALRSAAAAAVASLAGPETVSPAAKVPADPKAPWRGLKPGVATYSLRRLKLEPALKILQRLGLPYASVKDFHLPLDSTAGQRKAVRQKFVDAGVTPLSCGVITMGNDEADVRRAFEYARDLGVSTIVCNPHPDSMPLLDKFVKEFDFRLAIHNHGPGDKRWPSPPDLMKAVKNFDPRIGVCVDVGHTARAGVDPAEAVRACRERLYDVHLKDVVSTEPGSAKGPAGGETVLGRGALDLRSILQALLDARFAGHLGFEHEKDGDDPLPGLAESAGYAKGVLSCLTPA